MTLKPLWLAITLLALVGLTSYLTHPGYSADEVLNQARQIAELNRTINDLQARNRQLEQELQIPLNSQETKQLAAQQQTVRTIADAPATTEPSNAIALLHEERTRHKNEEYDLWLKNALQNGAHPAALMHARFEQEPLDSQWAPQQEQKIFELFTSSEDLRGTAIKSAKCRTTQCEILLASNSLEQSFQQFQRASKALQNQSPDSFVTFATNMETNTATLYLSTEALAKSVSNNNQ